MKKWQRDYKLHKKKNDEDKNSKDSPESKSRRSFSHSNVQPEEENGVSQSKKKVKEIHSVEQIEQTIKDLNQKIIQLQLDKEKQSERVEELEEDLKKK